MPSGQTKREQQNNAFSESTARAFEDVSPPLTAYAIFSAHCNISMKQIEIQSFGVESIFVNVSPCSVAVAVE